MTLREYIEEEIRARGPIPFSRYMELCLYGPGGDERLPATTPVRARSSASKGTSTRRATYMPSSDGCWRGNSKRCGACSASQKRSAGRTWSGTRSVCAGRARLVEEDVSGVLLRVALPLMEGSAGSAKQACRALRRRYWLRQSADCSRLSMRSSSRLRSLSSATSSSTRCRSKCSIIAASCA